MSDKNLHENEKELLTETESVSSEQETSAEETQDTKIKEELLEAAAEEESPSEPVIETEAIAEEKEEAISDSNDVEKDSSDEALEKSSEVVIDDTIEVEEKTQIQNEEDHDDAEDEEEVESSEDEHKEESSDEEEEVDYHSLSKKELIAALKQLLQEKPIQSIKNAVEEIKTEFNAKFSEELEHKKEEFLEEGGNIIDFQYSTPLKKEFNSVYFDYKEKRNNYYKNLKKDLQDNLEKRLELIEELKGLLNAEENINSTYKHFKEIQEKWHVAGPIPRDKYNLVWNTYHHHVENFYDFLHLNREFRDMDFKHNLEQKLKIIGRAEELAQEEDLGKAFRELQMLHKMWKEDVGPVAKEFRDEVWDKFSEATKVLHDKRQAYLNEMDAVFEQNFITKKELTDRISEITQNTKPNHKAWQNAIKKVQELRDQYFELGKVPRNKNKEIWNFFKEATRNFNHEKNSFYKNQKKEQYANLEKKQELVQIAEANKDSDDFEVVTALMKKIQQDWKKIGHVPRKDSDKIWKQFKDACNYFFDRLHAEKNEANKEEAANLETKESMLAEISAMELSGDQKADLALIKAKISDWKQVGRVPYNKKNIEQKFNKVLDGLFGKLKLSKTEAELIRFENKLNAIVSQEDERKLQNEKFFISKKITEVKDEIRQLENNLGFFQHVDQNNPLVKEVHKNIDRHKDQLEVWKAKMKKIKSLQ